MPRLQVHWLLWAYRLELLGASDMGCVWLASLAFFAANVLLLLQLIRTWSPNPPNAVLVTPDARLRKRLVARV